MADIDTGLGIPVSAYTNKDSAKKAVQDLVKTVLGVLKDGYIEIPTAISDEFDKSKASAKLIRAQKDFINQWEKMSKEGFSSSEEDLQAFVDKFIKFRRLMGKEGKGGSKQNLAIRDLGLNELVQNYKKQLNQIQAQIKTETTKQTRTRNTTSTRRRTPMTAEERRRQKQEEDEAVRYAINERNGINKFIRRLSKNSSGNRNPIGDIALGLRQPTLGNSDRVTSKSIQDSGRSPYQNYWGTLSSQLDKDNAELAKKTLRHYKLNPQELFEKNEEINSNPKRLEQQQLRNRSALDSSLLDSVKTTLKDITKGDLGLEQQLGKIIDANIARGQEKAEPSDVTANKIVDEMMKVFYPYGDRIGSTNGNSKADLLDIDEIHDIVKKSLDKLGKQIESTCQQVNNLTNTFNESITNTGSDRIINQEIDRLNNSDDSEIQNLNRAQTRQNSILENQRRLDMIEYDRESTSDKQALDVAKDDAGTGFNTDANAKELSTRVTTGNRISDQTQGILQEISSDLLGKNETPIDIAELGDTSNGLVGNWINILQNINKNISNILSNVVKISSGKGGSGGQSRKRKSEPKPIGELPSDQVINPETGRFYTSRVIDQTVDNRPIALHDESDWESLIVRRQYQERQRKESKLLEQIEQERSQIEEGEHPSQIRTSRMSNLDVYSSQPGFFGKLEKIIKRALPMSEVERIMNANAEEQERMRVERINTFGINNARQLTDTGDIANVRRTKELFGWVYRSDKDNRELFQNIQLTPGMGELDTTNIMKALNKVLSGPEMFRAQTGGVLRNFVGMMTGYIGMPSIEKTRSQAEGLNQVMADVRNEVLGLVQAIKSDETTLRGMEREGTVAFDSEGQMIRGTSASRKIFADMEERKGTLKAALAEVSMIDQVVAKTGGRIPKIIKQIGFVMPELMQSNTILQNLNAGLDKNGKALKFQTRFAENLNYTFQLMARHVGQILKNWMLQLNPLYQIKRLFDDYASYDPKWQRTMNVIKYNLRDIVRPLMEWISQQLVNIIGFLDIISMKIQEAFGYTPISLFDQKNADETKKTYEDIADISAGFDELHDVGSSTGENNPDDLLGEIYQPQLSQAWIDLANEIGDLFAGLIKGDLGFTEVMAKILQIAWKGITTLWSEIIWPFIKNTIWPAIQDNWLEILGWILGAFLIWKGLKLIPSLLISAFTRRI